MSEKSHSRPVSTTKVVGLFMGPFLFFTVLFFFHPEGLSDSANAVLASTLWVAAWWITEAMPIAVTSLLPIVLFPLTGGLGIEETTAAFGHRYIFLYIGGFILALAIERWNLHRRIALNIIKLIGTNIKSIILGFMVATAFLSMWISNTATSVMMLPIGMAIVAQMTNSADARAGDSKIFGKALMLAIAYSASIGGLATLIGTPPNLVLASVVQDIYNIEITFSKWIMFGLPISIIMLFISWKYLTEFAFSFDTKSFPGGMNEIQKQLNKLGEMSKEEKLVLTVFALTAFSWITRSYLLNIFVPELDDTMIAVIAAFILFLIPAPSERGRSLITWDEAVKLPWGILLLFGGGLALASGFEASGLAAWLGGQMNLLKGVSLIVLLLVLIASVNFLTEITSNLATTAMILPVLAPLAIIIDVHPYMLMVGATVSASFAFMLPVATPPNAVVFGSGYLRIPDMVKAGIWMNLISILILTAICFFVLPWIWDFVPGTFPAGWSSR